MLLGSRLLRLSAAVAGGVRRSLTTAASHPPWAMISFSSEVVGAPTVDVRLAEPPHISEIRVPERLIRTSGGCPDPASEVSKLLAGTASGGLLFLTYLDLRSMPPIAGKYGHLLDPYHVPGVTHLVCNPVTRELSRLPDSILNPMEDAVFGSRMGFITQADRGHGPPDRFAAARVGLGRNLMIRFLSETEKWELVEVSVSLSQLLPSRPMQIDQEPLAFGGRMWWVDLSWGAISADPFSDRPEASYVMLPRCSVLPAVGAPISYRRVGVSEGRLRYVEVSQEQRFLLRSFALDDEYNTWTLEHQVVLNKIWGRSMWIPLQTSGGDTDIVLIDPLNSNVVYLMVMSQIVAVDMEREEVIESCLCSSDYSDRIPCVLPPWLGSSQIPSAGKKDVDKYKTLAGVLVHSDNHYKR